MSWTDRIKKLVQRDKKEQIVEKGKGWTFDDPFSSVSGNLVVDAGYTNLKSALTMDQSLLARFADYENMDDYPELSCALDIFSDDTTITDNLRGKTIWGESKDTILKDIIDDCLHRRLRIEEDIWLAIRTLCKYGNVYAEIITTDIGVVGLNFLPVPTMRRLVTMKGDLVGFIQDLKGRFNTEGLAINDINKLKEQTKERGMIFFEPWEIVHWRLQSKFTNSLYGYAVFDAARWVWKRLVMLEDTALLYQLTRSPGRYAFYIDTGDLPPDEAMALVKKVKRQYKKRTLVNPSTGELEFRNNPLSPEDDMWIPTRSGKESARVDVLSGPDWQSMDSIEYLRDKMFTSIKIPRSYYGGDAEAEQGLAQKDVRFARTCMRIQREFRNGIRQILRVHLAAINIDPDTVEWDTRMTMPSSIFELQQIEVMNAQAGLIETLSQFFPKEWLLRRILHLSQDDAVSVVNDKMSEEERALMDQARIASSIEKRYPGIDIGDATIADAGQEARNEEVKFSREIKKLTEMVSKSMQESNRVIKKLEEMDLSSKRDTRKIDNSIKYIRRVK
jgi:hypothetical protein